MLEITFINEKKEKKLKGILAQMWLDCYINEYDECYEYNLPKKLKGIIQIKNLNLKKKQIEWNVNQKCTLILDNCKIKTNEIYIRGGSIELYQPYFENPCQVIMDECKDIDIDFLPSEYPVDYDLNSKETIHLKGNSLNQNVEISTSNLQLNHMQNLRVKGFAYTWNILNSEVTLKENVNGFYLNITNSKIKGQNLDFTKMHKLDLKKVTLEAEDKIILPNYTYVRKEKEKNVIVTDSLLDLESDIQYHNTKRNHNKGVVILARNYDSKAEGLSNLLSILKGLKEKVEQEDIEKIEQKATEKVINKLEILKKELEKTEIEYQKVLENSRKSAQNTALKRILK